MATALTLTPTLSMAQQLPTGGNVAAGTATINSPNGSTLNVNQTSDRAVINWSGFSVGQGATVNFNQPGASSATLNRVTGSTPSSIAGTINAPGTVLLVNPNGIAITKSGVVNVGSFAASTLDIKDTDFMSGKYNFSGNGSSAGVTNAGRINVSDGGFAALLGGQVANDGVISARLGKVGLGSGEMITLDLAGDGFLSVAVPTSSLNGIAGADGHPLVSNKGKIVADGGMVYLSAATAAGLLRDAVYVPGTIRANSVGTRGGKIVIGGGPGGKVNVTGKVKANGNKTAKGGTINISGAQVAVSGTVKANGIEGGTIKVTGTEKADVAGTVSAKGGTGKGGVVIVTANNVTLGNSAKLDVSGASGGTLLIGGDYQGGANAANNFSIEPVDNALTTTIAAGAALTADGTNGKGGNIVVWSDDKTTFAGALSVASSNGSGGFAEVSGHRLLDFTGTANLAGTAGAGTLLLDPRNVTISNGTDFNHDSSFVANGDNSVINVTTLQNALASGNVIVTTGGAGSAGSQAGDITVASNVAWSANTLTLQAYRSIFINAAMTATGTAGLTLTTNNGGTGGAISFAGNVTFANTSQSLVINGASYTLIDSMSALQNINNNLSGNYALMNSLDASGVSNWVPLGTDGTRSNLGTNLNGGAGFNGIFTGLGNAVSNLTVNLGSISNVGLFGMSNGGTISAVKLLNASFSGGSGIGGIVGYGSNLNIADIYVSGSMTGSGSYVGGIVGGTGINGGSITDAHADVAVSAQMSAGGIAGYFAGGSIALSSVTGSVHSSTQFAGGLAGQLSNSAVSDSYSIASVSADQARAGGLVGSATTITIATSWSSGLVSSPSSAGGLVGSGTATFTNAYWDTQTSGQTYATGTAAVAGATGLNTSQAATQASYSGFDFTNTWYTVANSTRPFLRSEYSTTISNAHQLQLINMNATTLSASYKIANDINLGAALSNASDMWGSKGWVPLGTDGAGGLVVGSGFNGVLDGQYHFIDGLTITRTSNYNGLVGYSSSGSISKLGLTNVNIAGGDKTGSVVGQLFGGSVSDSFATGSVAGGWQVGGLIGQTDNGAGVLRTYFNGEVAGSGGATGGLVGQSAGSISQSYAAARVTGSSTDGLGGGAGTVTNSYYDTLMFGGTSGLGTGYVTAQMQSALGGFDSNWGVVSGASYFYLKGFYPTAPQVVSGTASTNAGPAMAGEKVSVLVNGTNVGSAYTGANGYYNMLLSPGTIAAGGQVAAYTTGANAAVSYRQDASGSQAGLNLKGSYLTINSAQSTLSSMMSGMATAIGASGVSTALPNLQIAATASSLTIDQAINRSGTVILAGSGAVNQTAAIVADSLSLQTAAAPTAFTLTNAGNDVRVLSSTAISSGRIDFYDSNDLQTGGAITANGGIVIRAAGSLTINGTLSSTAAGDAVVLSAGTTFTNGASSSAISTPNGRWLVYAGTPTGSSFNNLNSNNAAIWNSTYVNNAPSTIASGNRYVFALQPTLTFTSTNASKYYGQTADVSSNYTVSSNVSTVSGAYTVAAPSTFYSGTPTLSSSGTATTATVAGGPYAINIAQGSVVATGGYALAFANTGALTVNKATLIIYGGSPNKTYGQTYSSTSDYSASGLYNGDSVTSVTLTSAGAAATANAGNYALTASNAQGTGLSNYNILYSDGSLHVGQAVLTITAASTSKQYGLIKTFAGTEFTSSGLLNGDTISSVTLSSTGAAGTANVGSYQINVSGATGAAMSNYMIYYNAGSLSVTPAPLTIASSDQAKTYGAAYNLGSTAFNITSGTLYNGNTITGVTLTSGAAAATAAVGWQSIVPSAATGSGLSNYNITYSAAGKLTVNPASLTITANNQSKTYGTVLGSNGQYAITNGTLFNGDTLTGVTLASAGFAGSATVAGGPYTITASNAIGTGLYNYTITYVPGTLTVDRAPLTITAGGQSKLYGDTLTLDPTKFTYGQLYNGDTVSSVTLASAGTGATAAAGTHAITASNAQGTGLGNYNITYVDGALTVNKASLIIYVGTGATKTYGNTYTGSSSDYSITGLKNADSVSSVDLTSVGAATTANVGSYILTGSNAQGVGLGNYNVSYQPGTLYVSPATLTINAANNLTKTYGANLAFNGTEFTATGLKNSDTISSVSLTSNGAAGTANVGGYQIAASNATGSGLSNYLIYYNTGSLNVTPAPITITPQDQAKTYGTAYNLGSTAFSITSGALFNGDTISGVTLTSGAAAATAAAGWQTIYASNATGAGLSNYAITYSTTGKLTVNPAPLTIAANDQTKTYGTVLGSNGQYAITSGTLFNGDTLTGVTLTSAGFAGSASVAGGPYAITASNATGNGLYNYAITYVPGTLTVNKASLVVTAADQSKTYGNTASLGTTGFTVTGNLYNGDRVNEVTLTSGGAAATATVAGGPYAITASNAQGSGLGNYDISYVDGALTVDKATLTVYAGSTGKTYGTIYTFGNLYTVSGLKNSDSVSSVDLASAGAAATANVGNYAVTAGNAQGIGLGNYNISYQPGSLNVGPAILTINAANGTKVYGSTGSFSGTEFSATGLVNGDTISSVQLTSAGTAANANVGSYWITSSNATGTGLSNYLIYYNQGSLSVTPAPLTITAGNQSKGYGTAANLGSSAFSITSGNLFNGDTITGVTLTSPGGAPATANVAGYSLFAASATGTGVSNYNITYVPGTLTVNPAQLVIKADDRSKTYGDTLNLGNTAYTVAGPLYNGDTVTGVTLASGGVAATASVSAGPYAIVAGNAQGSGLSNYTITYENGSLTVNKANLTVTANNASKNYGQTLVFNGTEFISSGLKNGETIGSVTLASAGAAATADVNGSPYTILASAAAGGTFNANNYNITYVNGALTVSPAALTVTITPNAATKVYGDTLNFAGTEFAQVGLVNGDTISGVTLTSAGTAATAAAGQYDIASSNAVFGSGSASNYNIVYNVLANGLTVTPRSLVITANGVSRIYGDANPATGSAMGNNLVNGDTVTGVTLSSSATTASGVGSYDLTGSNATGTGLGNYTITYATVANGMTVTPRSLVIAANSVSRIYGDTNPATGAATGNNLVNGDTITGVTLSSSATTASGVGSYDLTGASATGTGLGNYTITYATVANGLTVTPRSLVITANNVSRIYGDTNPAAGTATGNNLVNGDTITGVTLSSSATAASGVGGYDLTGANATGTGLGNYTITYATVANGLTVTPRSLVIAANGVSRIYGDANPATGTATGNNLINGDTITGVTLASSATATSGVGTYDLTGSNATGTGLGNYTITYATVANGLTVTPRSLVITANNVSRIYGDANPATGTATGNNLVNGDTITGVTLNTPATAASGVGGYDLTGSNATGTGLGNYTITYATVANGLTVTPRSLVITANNVSRIYGDANPATGTATGNNLVNGDTITGVTLSSSATTASGVGSYDLTGSNATGSGLGNYAITYATAVNGLTVTPRSLVITANSVSRTYGDANPATGTATGNNLVNGDTITGVTLSSSATTASGVGSYDLTGANATGTGLGNYMITYATMANGLTVTPRSLVIAANGVSRIYGDANPATGTATGNNLVNGDTVTGVTLSSSATTASGVGGYDLTGSNATGTGLGNYTITYATVANGLTVTPRALVVTADAVSRIYGDASPAAGTATGNNLVNGDTVTGVTLSSSATTASGVGSYDLTGSNATGTGLGNYTITYATMGNGLTVTPRSLVISANGVSRVYGDANPATGTAAGDNLVNGDTVTGVTLSSSATTTSSVGRYDLTGSNATGTGLSNYAITYATMANGLTVTPRMLEVTADAQSKTVGEADPLLTYRITNGNLVGSDTLTGLLTRVAGESAGAYAILQGSLAASANYSLAYIGANLTVIAPVVTTTPANNGNGDYATSQYVASTGANTAPIVNISYQPSAGSIPVISVVTAPRVSANPPANSNVATAAPAADPAQNIAPSGGPLALFMPISQFDKGQYASDALPGYAAEAGQAAVLTMVARAGVNNRTEPKIDALWSNGGSSWANVNETIGKTAEFGDGNGTKRKPTGDNGFTFVNGTTDIAAMLKSGPVMLGGAKPSDAASGTLWLLALQMTADGKGIIANDPVSGRQVVLAYDAAAKIVGGVTGTIDPATRQTVQLGETAPTDKVSIDIPAAAWSQLKSFTPTSYFAVTL